MNTKLLLTLLLTVELFLAASVSAIPAYPYPIKYKQPNGAEITIQLYGDEKVHWAETSDGYTLLSNGKNGWEYAVKDENGNLKTSGLLAKDVAYRTTEDKALIRKVSKKLRFSSQQVGLLQSAWEARVMSKDLVGSGQFFKTTPPTNNDGRQKVFTPTGAKKLLMILIQYTDVPFTYTKENFNALMNTQNYNLEGASGSVRDYYLEQSYDLFDITTDVVGIYTADYNMAHYGANDSAGDDINAGALMKEACEKADADGVDFTKYDNDGDGSVDGVYIVFSGYGEASSGIDNTIWPHAGGISGQTFDGKTVSKYSCSNELNYNGPSTPGTITTIGVICHEFGHVCGAPDYYDTDYTIGGQFTGNGKWDLMDVGSYNGVPSGSVPPHFNPFEKIRAGWLTPTPLTTTTAITNMPDITSNPVVYKFNTSTADEYYLLENRQNTGFNSYCPGHGLMIYHYSKKYWDISANTTAPQGFYPVCASATTTPTISSSASAYGNINTGGCPFPGTSSKTSFVDNIAPSAKSWVGNNSYKPLTGITESTVNKTIGFKFMEVTSGTPPTTQATNFTGTYIQENQITLNWTRGSGDKIIVLARRNAAINTTPLSGTAFNANSSFGSGDQIDPGTYVVYNGNGTSVTITDLIKNSTYYFAAFEYSSTDICYLTPGLTANIATIGCTPCSPSTTNTGFGIKGITFNTINNTSSVSSGYSDYSDITTQVSPGSTYVLSVQTYSYVNTIYTKAWIDWNNDCTFQANEEFDLGSSTNDATVTKSITIPSNIKTSSVTLRVRSRIGSAPTACNLNNYSEAEDYTLKIIGGCTPPTVQATNLTASNVQTEQMTLNWTRGNGNKVLVIARQGSAVDSYLIGVNSFTANADFGLGTQIGTGNYVVYNGTNNNITITGLTPESTYYFAVYEYDAASNCFLTPALTTNFTTNTGTSYCIPTESITNSLGITNVTLNTINNNSGTASLTYTNYNNLFTNIVKNQSYNLSVSVNTNGNNTIYTKAWIDWNKDGTFDETEKYNLGSNTNVSNALTSNSPLSITVPSTATNGTIRMRVITRFGSAPIACGNNDYSEAEDYILKVINPTTIWDGTAWNAGIPTELYDVEVDGNYSGAGFTCNNLTINAGKLLTVSSGTLTVNGNILMKSDENGTATLVNNGNINTNIKGNVEQYLPVARNWYVSSPTSNASLPMGYTCYVYHEPGDNTGYTAPATAYWQSVTTGTSLTPGVGYIALPASNGLTISFSTGSTGHLNDGEVTIPLTKTNVAEKPGFNLIGNPYPSYINIMTPINTNSALEKTVWYRTRSIGDSPAYYFETVNTTSGIGTNNNGLGSVTGYIPPMQGFWVRSNTASANLVLNNNYRTHASVEGVTTTPLKVTTDNKLVRLQVSNGTKNDETIVYFNANATPQIDIYDSEKMMNNNETIPEIYSLINGKNLAINGRNEESTEIVVPLGFSTDAANTYQIRATSISGFSERKIVLKDQNSNAEFDLTTGNAYSFSSDATTDNTRFVLVFKSLNTTGIEQLSNGSLFTAFEDENNKITIVLSQKPETQQLICMYNSVGQLVYTGKLIEATSQLNKVFEPGVYLISLNIKGVNQTKKLVIK